MENAKPMLKREHIVWLDVVRFVAMFTVVCCHSADPFNFYPGEPPAKHRRHQVLGSSLRRIPASLRPAFRNDNRRIVASC